MPDREAARSELVAENVLYTVAPSGKRHVVFGHLNDEGCDVCAIDHPVTQLAGRFGSGSRVLALRDPAAPGTSAVWRSW